MPVIGIGLFASLAPNAPLIVLGSLVGHLLYGAVLEALYGAPSALYPEPRARGRAMEAA